jgi:hypothetical protein
LQYRTKEGWTTEILTANQTAKTFPDFAPDVIAISAVDRVGNVSQPVVLKKTPPVHTGKVLLYY